jgi:futalosine hydrolase
MPVADPPPRTARPARTTSAARRLLVVTSVAAEAAAVVARLPGQRAGPGAADDTDAADRRPRPAWCASTPAGEVTVACCGVGPAAAAAGTAALLSQARYDAVVCAGIAGGFAGRAGLGEVVVADRVLHADLGADSPDGFLGAAELGFGEAGHRPDPVLVAAVAARTGGTAGTVLTVSTVTGTEARARQLAARYQPVAEAMEGAGVLAAARALGVPMLEIRTVANLVGRRDRSRWDVPAALAALAQAMAALFEDELV